MKNAKDVVEQFLMDGGPEAPESRATKWDLKRAIETRDKLLRSLREVLLETVAAEVARANKEKREGALTVESLTSDQLTALVGNPIPVRVHSEFFEKAGKVCDFINKIGAHRLVSITAYSYGQSKGQRYTVFYKE